MVLNSREILVVETYVDEFNIYTTHKINTYDVFEFTLLVSNIYFSK